MSDDKHIVFVGRRGGAIIGTWSTRPVMMDIEPRKRTQDADVQFEALPEDHNDVVAFRNRPPPAFDPVKARTAGAVDPGARLAALEAEVTALKAARGPKGGA